MRKCVAEKRCPASARGFLFYSTRIGIIIVGSPIDPSYYERAQVRWYEISAWVREYLTYTPRCAQCLSGKLIGPSTPVEFTGETLEHIPGAIRQPTNPPTPPISRSWRGLVVTAISSIHHVRCPPRMIVWWNCEFAVALRDRQTWRRLEVSLGLQMRRKRTGIA